MKDLPKIEDPRDINVTRPYHAICLVTRETAQNWLKLNAGNRRLRRAAVEYLVKQLQNHEWREDHPVPICFSSDGRLIDGQHRLQAVVESGGSVFMYVRFGCNPEVRPHLDNGITRSMADRVVFIENVNHNRVAASLVSALHYRHGAPGDKKYRKPSPAEAICVFEKFQAPVSYFSSHWKSVRKVTTTAVFGALCEFWLVYGGEKAIQFANAIYHVDSSIQPARVLRDWLLRHDNAGAGAPGMQKSWRFTIFACTAFVERRSVRQLRMMYWRGYENAV